MTPAQIGPIQSVYWQAWTALASLGAVMITLCGLLARLIWNLSKFTAEVRHDRTLRAAQILELNNWYNRLHHRTTAIAIAGTQTATLVAFPSESKVERTRNVDEWRRILTNSEDVT